MSSWVEYRKLEVTLFFTPLFQIEYILVQITWGIHLKKESFIKSLWEKPVLFEYYKYLYQ